MSELEIFIATEQPETCSRCGIRTKILLEIDNMQYHQCSSISCGFEFILEFEVDV